MFKKAHDGFLIKAVQAVLRFNIQHRVAKVHNVILYVRLIRAENAMNKQSL